MMLHSPDAARRAARRLLWELAALGLAIIIGFMAAAWLAGRALIHWLVPS